MSAALCEGEQDQEVFENAKKNKQTHMLIAGFCAGLNFLEVSTKPGGTSGVRS